MHSIKIDGTEFRFFNHLYAVSRFGKVLRNLEPYIPPLRKDGYLTCGRKNLLHRVVAICWLKKPEGTFLVHHKNRNKTDNRVSNLEWVTSREHMGERHIDIAGRHVVSEETRAKLRMNRLGCKTTDATKQKQREASLRLGLKPPPRPFGFKCSKESIALMRRNNPMNTSCRVSGVKYPSYAEASRSLGIRLHTIRKRCLSKNFPNYKIHLKK